MSALTGFVKLKVEGADLGSSPPLILLRVSVDVKQHSSRTGQSKIASSWAISGMRREVITVAGVTCEMYTSTATLYAARLRQIVTGVMKPLKRDTS